MIKNLNNTPNKKFGDAEIQLYSQRAIEIKDYLDEQISVICVEDNNIRAEVSLVNLFSNCDNDTNNFEIYKFDIAAIDVKKNVYTYDYFPLNTTNEEAMRVVKNLFD